MIMIKELLVNRICLLLLWDGRLVDIGEMCIRDRFYSDNTEFGIGSRGNGPVVVVDGIQRELYSLDPEAIESVSYTHLLNGIHICGLIRIGITMRRAL